jgi:hypothetical protein
MPASETPDIPILKEAGGVRQAAVKQLLFYLPTHWAIGRSLTQEMILTSPATAQSTTGVVAAILDLAVALELPGPAIRMLYACR